MIIYGQLLLLTICISKLCYIINHFLLLYFYPKCYHFKQMTVVKIIVFWFLNLSMCTC